jgi:hypothetical protein
MKRLAAVTLAVVCVATACARTSDGVPVAEPGGLVAVQPSAPQATSGAAPPTESGFGVVPTTRVPVPANSVVCSQALKPSVRMTAEVDDPQAPKITVGVPDKWSMTAGTGDVGGQLDGPGGMQATVTIAPTQLEPGEAFRKYADDLMAESSVSSVSVLPGDLCGYSGQKLMGAWSETTQNAVVYEDRIAHIWTNGGNNYLVSVHVQAPPGTPGFDSAAALLTEDFEILIP